MRKLSLYILAASIAFLPAGASAQGGPHGAPPAGPHGGPRPSAGHSWRGGGFTGPGAHGPNVMIRQGNPGMHGRFMHPGPNFRHQRMQRGFFIHPFWFGSQFHINNWQMYGFADPGADGRWVRYYDDAYLIDRGGRVVDTRYGMDWDRYGEEWGDEDGIPAYRGGRDHDDDDEHGWAEHGGGEGGYAMQGGGYGPPMPGGGYSYGYGAAYGGYSGYGAYAYPIIIETITTGATTYTEEVTEEYVEVRRPRRVHRRPRPRCVCAAPPRPVVRRPAPRPAPPRRPPPAGERG